MADKVTLNIKDGKATITEGENSLVGKLLVAKGKIKINTPLVKQDIEIKK